MAGEPLPKRARVRVLFSYRVRSWYRRLLEAVFMTDQEVVRRRGMTRRTLVHGKDLGARAVRWAEGIGDNTEMWVVVTSRHTRVVDNASRVRWEGQAEVTRRGWGAGVRLPFDDGSSVVLPVGEFKVDP